MSESEQTSEIIAPVDPEPFIKKKSVKKQKITKISILGKGVVGKTSIAFKMKNFDLDLTDEHYPTIEERLNFTYDYEGKPVEIELLDTAGEDDYQNMMDVWIEYGDCILLVFSLTSKSTFEHLDVIYQRIRKIKGEKVYLLMIGNKSDLGNREVTNEEAVEKAQKWNISYLETSAKTGDNIMKILDILLNKMEKDNKLHEDNKTKSSDITGDSSMFNSSVQTFESESNVKKYILIIVIAVILLIIAGGLVWKFIIKTNFPL